MIIKWLDDAVDDLQALRLYIAKDKPSAANRVAKQILNAVNFLPHHPDMGRLGRVANTRELIIPNLPYVIPYRVRHNAIEILRVFHAAMQWPSDFCQ